MSVRKPDRGNSAMDFMHNGLALRKEVTELLLRDFGVKSKVREALHDAKMDEKSVGKLLQIASKYNLKDEDREALADIIYNCTYDTKVLDQFPVWLIDYFRTSILHIVEDLMRNLYLGNSIYITQEDEYLKRREHWNAAIGCVYNLAGWLDYVRQTLPVDANKYERYLERCRREIDMLKGVRKTDNAVMGKIRKRKVKSQSPQ